MLPILYENVEAGIVPAHYGVGVLRDCLSCVVSEERNGAYELEMSYPANGVHAADIVPNCVIKVKPNPTDDPQLFRVYKIGKTMAGVFTIAAHHISYDLSGVVIASGTASDVAGACDILQNAAVGFTISTDKQTVAPFKIYEPSSVRSWFGGKNGSLLDAYGGEWYWNNYDLRLKGARGADRGVYIRYGKNLTELSQEMDISNLATSITPYYIDEESDITIVGDAVNTGLTLNPVKNIAIDFSSDVDEESETPITEQLEALALKYIANNELGAAVSTITLNFVQLSDLTERIDLCDIAHIEYEALGITVVLKCIATTWDALEERYTSIKFGKGSTDITDTILKTEKEVKEKPTITAMQSAINKATELITGNRGGYVILKDTNADGEPDEILITDNADLTQAVKVWRWNKNGLGYSSTGYNGSYGLAVTSQGEIVADFIKTGTLNADLIKAGKISDVNGRFELNLLTGTSRLNQAVSERDFSVIDALGNHWAYLSTTVNGAKLAITDGVADVAHERVTMFANDGGGVLNLTDGDFNSTVRLDGNGGHIVQKNGIELLYDTPLYTGGNSIPAGEYSAYLFYGRVSSGGSYIPVIIPKSMITTSEQKFIFADETNYYTFIVYWTDDTKSTLWFTANTKNNNGALTHIYGIY